MTSTTKRNMARVTKGKALTGVGEIWPPGRTQTWRWCAWSRDLKLPCWVGIGRQGGLQEEVAFESSGAQGSMVSKQGLEPRAWAGLFTGAVCGGEGLQGEKGGLSRKQLSHSG